MPYYISYHQPTSDMLLAKGWHSITSREARHEKYLYTSCHSHQDRISNFTR